MKNYNILFILLLIGLFIFFYKSFNEGYSSIIPMNCNDPNNNTNLLRYDCR
jgi:hypothetical protein